MSDQSRALYEELGNFLRKSRSYARANAKRIHPELEAASYVVLSCIINNGPVRARKIGQELGLDKGVISRHLQHLENLGLITRQEDSSDRRAAIITATAPAKEKWEKGGQIAQEAIREHVTAWSEEDLAKFIHLFKDLNRINFPQE